MLFNSYIFILVFLPITLAVYLFLQRRGKQNRCFDWLVLASLFFYGWWKWTNLPLLAGSMVFNYAVGTSLGRMVGRRRSRGLLALGVAGNLAFLGYFKYTNFLISNLNALTGSGWTFAEIVLPLGISFFTFQEIAYLVDSYRGQTRNYGFRDFCLFVSFFPQLIAGPIVHHAEMMPQFRSRTTGPVWENLSVGLTLFTFGLAKKVLIADRFALLASPMFNTAAMTAPGLPAAWLGALCYAMQIYFDFSAYSDMAIGLARMFGIRLPLNFNSPYKATSITDFWRRWHMTLSRFLRDYLYIPLGGNRRGPTRRYLNLMITMLLGGLWHGAGWTFVLWGALHGIYLCIHHGWQNWRSRFGRTTSPPSTTGIWAARLVTFLAVVVAWVFFRADSLDSALTILKSMVGLNGSSFVPEAMNIKRAIRTILMFLPVVWFFPTTHEVLAAYKPALEYVQDPPQVAANATPVWLRRWLSWRPVMAWALVLTVLMVWDLMSLSLPTEFIYWQF